MSVAVSFCFLSFSFIFFDFFFVFLRNNDHQFELHYLHSIIVETLPRYRVHVEICNTYYVHLRFMAVDPSSIAEEESYTSSASLLLSLVVAVNDEK